MNTRNLYFILIILLISVGQSGLTLYLPSLPVVANEFHVHFSSVELTITLYVVGIGCAQFIYGPLSDRYGRRKMILISLILFILGCLLAAFSNTIDSLLIARLVQGLGVGAFTTIGRAINRDIYSGTKYFKISMLTSGALAITPMIAPFIGVYIQKNFGWKNNFFLMTLFSSIVFLLWFFLFKETNYHSKEHALSIKKLVRSYVDISKSLEFITNTLCGGLVYAGEIIFLTLSPYLFKNEFGIKLSAYAWLVCIGTISFITGIGISYYFSKYIANTKLVIFGLLFLYLSGLLLYIPYDTDLTAFIMISLSFSAYMFGASYIYSTVSATAIQSFSRKTGTASSLLGGLQSIVAGLFSAIAASFSSTEIKIKLFCILLIITIMASSTYYVYLKYQTTSK